MLGGPRCEFPEGWSALEMRFPQHTEHPRRQPQRNSNHAIWVCSCIPTHRLTPGGATAGGPGPDWRSPHPRLPRLRRSLAASRACISSQLAAEEVGGHGQDRSAGGHPRERARRGRDVQVRVLERLLRVDAVLKAEVTKSRVCTGRVKLMDESVDLLIGKHSCVRNVH